MTNDETQRTMDFIVNQRVQFRAGVLHLKELYSQAAKRFAKTEDVLTQLDSVTLTLTEEMIELVAAQSHMDNKMANLAESQEHTVNA